MPLCNENKADLELEYNKPQQATPRSPYLSARSLTQPYSAFLQSSDNSTRPREKFSRQHRFLASRMPVNSVVQTRSQPPVGGRGNSALIAGESLGKGSNLFLRRNWICAADLRLSPTPMSSSLHWWKLATAPSWTQVPFTTKQSCRKLAKFASKVRSLRRCWFESRYWHKSLSCRQEGVEEHTWVGGSGLVGM